MKKAIFVVSIAILLNMILTSCGFSGVPLAMVNPAPEWLLVTKDPNAAPTATPFQPIAKTPVNTLAPTSTPEPTPAPTEEPAEGSIDLSQYDTPEGQINFLILGSDWRPGMGYRTDVIMLVGINANTNKVSIVSFPRDLCLYIPGTASGYDAASCDRINTAMQYGFPTTVQTFQANLGVTPDYYAMTNFQGFITLVNSLGGIDVETDTAFSDKCKLPQASGGYCYVNVGSNHMDGDFALWYVRSRYTTSDYDRERRAQEVLRALFRRMLNLDVLAKIPDMYAIYTEYVETNIPLEVVLSLAKVALSIDLSADIYHETIAPPEVIDTISPAGAYISLPNHYYIDPIIKQAFFSE
ncbi:MAG: LCP family protein [Anaerolineaceae bacterium]|nr:LCP family protein [Anaerolineaceae bacterium]